MYVILRMETEIFNNISFSTLIITGRIICHTHTSHEVTVRGICSQRIQLNKRSLITYTPRNAMDMGAGAPAPYSLEKKYLLIRTS